MDCSKTIADSVGLSSVCMGFESGFTEFGGRDESARMVGGDSVGIGNGCHGLLGQVRAQQREREPAEAAGDAGQAFPGSFPWRVCCSWT
jgi:hypothetical protein